MRNIFFYTIAITFMSGIFIRSFFNIENAFIALLGVIGTALICAGWCLKSRYSYSPLFLLGLTLICFSLGVLRFHIAETSPSVFVEQEGEHIHMTARVVREPDIRETAAHLYVAPKEHAHELILVTTDPFTPLQEKISYGDLITIEGVLKIPEPFESEGGRVFNYPGYLKARGVTYMISFADVSIMAQEEHTFLGTLFQAKQRFIETLEMVIPEPYAGLGEGILLGVKRAIGSDLEAVFRETGVIHIVVLSGYNIMIVVECIMFVLSFFLFPRMRMLIGLLSIILFALLVGLSATVLRASVMAGLLIVARATGNTYAIMRALMLAGIGMLIINPYLLVHDPGFQLSFLATLGLILVAPSIEKRVTIIPALGGIRGFITATIATQIFVLPLLLYQMGTLSLVSVFVNALVLPMVPIAMLLTFLTGIIGMVSPTVGMGIGYLPYLALGYIIKVPELFAQLPFASYEVRAFPFWIMLFVYGALAFILIYFFRSSRIAAVRNITNDYQDWIIVEEKNMPSSK